MEAELQQRLQKKGVKSQVGPGSDADRGIRGGIRRGSKGDPVHFQGIPAVTHVAKCYK